MTRSWFEPLADHMGPAYLRYSFTKGTRQEVDFLVAELDLAPGMRVLDVGCGPGRHALELARRGLEVVGVDISATFLDLARSAAAAEGLGATFVRADARALPVVGPFDAVLSLCQGGFGLLGPEAGARDPDGPDQEVLAGMARVLRPGGRLVVSAFSAYFRVRNLDGSGFDAATGVNHEHTEVMDGDGVAVPAELWTTCYTPRELRLMATAAGLAVDAVWSVEPGGYARAVPHIDSYEFLLVAHRP